jgi:hypothetical protein
MLAQIMSIYISGKRGLVTYRVASCDTARASTNTALPGIDGRTNILQPGDAEDEGSGGADAEIFLTFFSVRRDHPFANPLHLPGARQ